MAILYEGVGDVFAGGVDLIVVPVNCVGAMGAGIALYVKKRFPETYRSYKHACDRGDFKPGMTYEIGDISGARFIFFPTKRHWKDRSRLSDVEDALDYLVKRGHIYEGLIMAFPPIGCGYGGLDYFKQVRPLLLRKLEEAIFDSVILLPSH